MCLALIPKRVLVQIQLMIVLRVPPLPSLYDLGRDLAVIPLLIDLGCDLTRNFLLLSVVVKDARAVLRAAVVALAVECCGVVHPVEELEDLGVAQFRRVVGDLCSFGV